MWLEPGLALCSSVHSVALFWLNSITLSPHPAPVGTVLLTAGLLPTTGPTTGHAALLVPLQPHQIPTTPPLPPSSSEPTPFPQILPKYLASHQQLPSLLGWRWSPSP